MNSDSVQQRMDAYFRERAEQPFGDVELASGRTLAQFSEAGRAAAENLLTKADRALAVGDVERATRLVDRAAALEYDDREQTAPAAWTVHMMLFDAVMDELEDSDEGDPVWLEAALAALTSADGWGQTELRHVLLVVRKDYVIEPSEDRAIMTAVDQVPERPELPDTVLPPKELASAVTSVLQTLQLYRAALVAARLQG